MKRELIEKDESLSLNGNCHYWSYLKVDFITLEREGLNKIWK